MQSASSLEQYNVSLKNINYKNYYNILISFIDFFDNFAKQYNRVFVNLKTLEERKLSKLFLELTSIKSLSTFFVF